MKIYVKAILAIGVLFFLSTKEAFSSYSESSNTKNFSAWGKRMWSRCDDIKAFIKIMTEAQLALVTHLKSEPQAMKNPQEHYVFIESLEENSGLKIEKEKEDLYRTYVIFSWLQPEELSRIWRSMRLRQHCAVHQRQLLSIFSSETQRQTEVKATYKTFKECVYGFYEQEPPAFVKPMFNCYENLLSRIPN